MRLDLFLLVDDETYLGYLSFHDNPAQSVRDRLEDEAYMLSQVINPMVPKFYAFEHIKKQGILMMERALGETEKSLSNRAF